MIVKTNKKKKIFLNTYKKKILKILILNEKENIKNHIY